MDFVDLRFWPVFNVADMAITCGCILFVLWPDGLRSRRPVRAPGTVPGDK